MEKIRGSPSAQRPMAPTLHPGKRFRGRCAAVAHRPSCRLTASAGGGSQKACIGELFKRIARRPFGGLEHDLRVAAVQRSMSQDS